VPVADINKVKFTLSPALKDQRGSRGIVLYSFFNLTFGGGGSAPFSPPRKETQFQFCRRLGGPQAQSGWVWKNLVPIGI